MQVIEKDFWICWVLRRIFSLEGLCANLVFKGGTSLSKVFRITERMSEDIDLVIDRGALGFADDHDPSSIGITGKERDRRLGALKQAAARWVAGPFAEALARGINESIASSGPSRLSCDAADPGNTVLEFRYPTIERASTYLRPIILLELGARGETWPEVSGVVTPYAAEELPDQFERATTKVRAITAERTLWEKATLLHAIAHHGAARAKRAMPARHYYDVYRLWMAGVGRDAAQDQQLLRDVVRHKEIFFREPRACYAEAVTGSLRLVPSSAIIDAIRADYAAMTEELVFGPAPSLDEIISVLAEIERIVNEGSR